MDAVTSRRRRLRWRLAALTLVGALGCAPPPPAPRPHGILLVVLDTLRADGLGSYGNPRPTSPAIDELARSGVLFERATSHAAWTLPGFIGLLSGEHPSHAVYAEGRLRRSLVERLRSAGYRTAAFTEGAYVSRAFGMDLGFDEFVEIEAQIRLRDGGSGEDAIRGARGGIAHTFDAAIAWLRAHSEEPFFLLVHSYEPHLPYRRRDFAESLPAGSLGPTYEVADARSVHEGARSVGPVERDYVRALYDGGVLESDRQVGRLLAALEALGLADRTVVAVTSDHGEDLGERDLHQLGRHQHQLHDDLLHVPLVLRDPREDFPVRRVGTQVRLTDVLPTLLELADLQAPANADGRSLVSLMRGAEQGDRIAFASLSTPDLRLAAIRTRDAKVVLQLRPPRAGETTPDAALYDLRADPLERDPRAAAGDPRLARLSAALRAWMRQVSARGDATLAPEPARAGLELREQLRALGYVSD